jgi:16S rRNA (cytosine967-C5)-methyltransferase
VQICAELFRVAVEYISADTELFARFYIVSPVVYKKTFLGQKIIRFQQIFVYSRIGLYQTYFAGNNEAVEKLERGRKVTEVEGFTDGKFIVQDPGTRLAIELLCVNAGEKILDACAAPGGKTIQIAWRGAETVACEVNPKRRRRLVENLRRSKLADNVQVIDNLDGEDVYDKVLVDAPCSNTGVFRRRPDARWNWNEEKLNALVTLQAQILDKVAAAVKPGGRLVYSTCSNELEENQQQVEAFLKRHPEFVLVQMNESVPFISGHDGAFAAALDRKLQ